MNANKGKDMMLLVGNTSTGIYKNQNPDIIFDISGLSELTGATLDSRGATFGAAVTITTVINLLTEWVQQAKYPNYMLAKFSTLVDHMYKIANFPVRNIACWAGNIMLW